MYASFYSFLSCLVTVTYQIYIYYTNKINGIQPVFHPCNFSSKIFNRARKIVWMKWNDIAWILLLFEFEIIKFELNWNQIKREHMRSDIIRTFAHFYFRSEFTDRVLFHAKDTVQWLAQVFVYTLLSWLAFQLIRPKGNDQRWTI